MYVYIIPLLSYSYLSCFSPSLNLLNSASSTDEVQSIVNKARTESGSSLSSVTVYTRFFLHSIDDVQEAKFFKALSDVLVAGDMLYFEFRSKEDEVLDKVHGKGHYRRYVDTPVMMESLKTLGFDIGYHITGLGMAKYKKEDPFVSRIIATKVYK